MIKDGEQILYRSPRHTFIGDTEYFGEYITAIRNSKRLDQESFARALRFSVSDLQKLEDGTLGAFPTTDGLKVWSKTLELDEETTEWVGLLSGHPMPELTPIQERDLIIGAVTELTSKTKLQ